MRWFIDGVVDRIVPPLRQQGSRRGSHGYAPRHPQHHRNRTPPRQHILAVGGLCAASIYACGDGGTEPPPTGSDPLRPATVGVAPATVPLTALGATEQLTAEVRDQNGKLMAGAAVSWSSSAAAVATVSASGLVTAATNGTATITATAGSASGSAAATVAQEVSTVAVSTTTDTVVLGDTLRLAAEAYDENGYPVPGAEFAWASTDTLVAVVDDEGHVTSIGRGETAITAAAAEVTGQVGLTVVAPDGVVLPGTVWVSPEIITEDDASTLDSLVYVGRGMRGFYDPFEGERRWRDDLELFLFEAHFGGGALIHVQAHPAYGEADSALAAARQFLPPMGRLPRMLIDGGREVELSPAPSYGAGGNACGKIYHWGARARPAGFVEEVALHEGSHAVLEDCVWDGCRIDCAGLGGSRSDEWRAAQAADGLFISVYARDHPDREDMAETLWAWFVSRCVPDRLPPEYKRRIDAGIPHRLAYFDRLGLDMRPWEC